MTFERSQIKELLHISSQDVAAFTVAQYGMRCSIYLPVSFSVYLSLS